MNPSEWHDIACELDTLKSIIEEREKRLAETAKLLAEIEATLSNLASFPELGSRESNPNRCHFVTIGETLPSLAERYYGDRSAWRTLYEMNRATIGRDPNSLAIGLVLRVPILP